MPMLNIGQYAEMTGFNRETVKKRLVDITFQEGPRASRLYDSHHALPAIYQVDKLDKTIDLTQARAVLATKQSAKIDLDMELRRGDYAIKSDVVDAIIAVFTAFRSKMLGLPSKSVPRLKVAKNEVEQEQILLELVHDALKELKNPAILDGGSAGDNLQPVRSRSGPSPKTNRK